jgi:formate-dependent nitrite reductase cytochrome c552 subunit
MSTVKKFGIYLSGIMLLGMGCVLPAIAGGPPLKQNACIACHKDYNTIMPKKHPEMGKGVPCLTCHAPNAAQSEATKFSTEVHKVHQSGKIKQECSACHAL